MKALFSFLILFAALPVMGQADKRAELAAVTEAGHLPAVEYFLRGLGGARGGAAAEFAQASPDDAKAREAEWLDFDSLLRGGKFDANGANIRRELAKLPGAQWHFVIKLERERRALYKKLGWGPGGNMYQNACAAVGVNVDPRLCFQRREQLTKSMEPAMADPAFSGWKAEDLIANYVTVRDGPRGVEHVWDGIHEAPCFVFDTGRGRVELVADAWANSLTPAYTWWYNFDKGTHAYMYKAGGADWCSQAMQEKAVRAQAEARRAKDGAAPRAAPKSGTLNSIGSKPF